MQATPATRGGVFDKVIPTARLLMGAPPPEEAIDTAEEIVNVHTCGRRTRREPVTELDMPRHCVCNTIIARGPGLLLSDNTEDLEWWRDHFIHWNGRNLITHSS